MKGKCLKCAPWVCGLLEGNHVFILLVSEQKMVASMVASTFLFLTDEDNEEEEEEVPLKNRPSCTPRAGGWEDGALGEHRVLAPPLSGPGLQGPCLFSPLHSVAQGTG